MNAVSRPRPSARSAQPTRLRRQLLFALACCVGMAGATPDARAAMFTVKNNCSYTVYPGIYPASVYANGGWTLSAGASVSFNVPSGSIGRLWGRTGCNSASPAVCATGSCGGTGLQCAGTTGVPNTSLFEWNINAAGTDWYDVSYVDAIDNPLGVVVSNSTCVSPSACSASVLTSCPADLKSGSVCLSPCTRYNTDQYCCRGAYGTQATCVVANWAATARTYVNNVHSFCPRSYAYAYDEGSGALQTCSTGANYTITFCPSGSGGGGGGTSYALTVTKAGTGSGTVTSSPAGISCGSACSASFASGTAVTLTAAPASGSTFAGWGGACSGTGTCSTTMSAARAVTATFNTSGGGGGGGSGGGTTIGSTVITSTINSATSITFRATNVQWADVHYVVNNGGQLNVRMAQSGSTATYSITTPAGAPVRYAVTFWGVGATGARDTDWMTVR